ncbi:MAG: GAF domain-containing protein, partial [Chloroflexia bacterium]|nr:GAF domain-containing protein [Chloroflexia bacterium]
NLYAAAQQLVDYQRELEELNLTLEQRVAQRTAELEAQQEALRDSEQRLSLHVQQTPLAVMEWDLDFRVVEWNPGAERIFGYSRAEALGRHACDLVVSPALRQEIMLLWRDILAQRGGTRNTNENVTKDNKTIVCEWYNTVLVNQEGRAIGVASLAMDITERQQAEEALREYQQQLEDSFQREQGRRRLSETLREVAKIVSSTLEQDQVLELILAQLEFVVPCHHASVTLLSDKEQGYVVKRSSSGHIVKQGSVEVDHFPLNVTALRAKRPIIVQDVSRDKRWQPTPETTAIRSFINAPLLIQDRAIGLLGVGRCDEIPFSREDAETIFAFASQVAIALENARLAEQTQQALRETEGLFRAAQSILGSNDLLQICQNLISSFNKLVQADRTTLFLVDQGRREILLHLSCGNVRNDIEVAYDELMQSVSGQVFRWRKPLLFHEPLDAKAPGIECRLHENAGSLAVVPLAAKNAQGKSAIIGSVTAINRPEQRLFNQHDLDLLMALAAQAATTIENVRLQEESERLLLNILPAPIALRLRHGESVIADHFDDVTVLFADVVNFTGISTRMQPDDLVVMLNHLFSTFDRLVEKYNLEKVKTVGDAYMVVGGLLLPHPRHAEAVADMALDMQQEVARFQPADLDPLNIRIGIHTGPVVAGVIGIEKFSYDMWGDTVNTASRMASHGLVGCIQLTESTRRRLSGDYVLEERGTIPIKGKGEMSTFLLLGKGPAPAGQAAGAL